MQAGSLENSEHRFPAGSCLEFEFAASEKGESMLFQSRGYYRRYTTLTQHVCALACVCARTRSCVRVRVVRQEGCVRVCAIMYTYVKEK